MYNRSILFESIFHDIPSGCKLARWHFFPRERNFRRRFRAITRDKSLPSLFFDLPPSGNPGNIEGSGNTRGWPPRKHCSLPSFSPELIFEGVKKEKRESKFSIFLSRVGNEIETKRERVWRDASRSVERISSLRDPETPSLTTPCHGRWKKGILSGGDLVKEPLSCSSGSRIITSRSNWKHGSR